MPNEKDMMTARKVTMASQSPNERIEENNSVNEMSSYRQRRTTPFTRSWGLHYNVGVRQGRLIWEGHSVGKSWKAISKYVEREFLLDR